MKDETQSATVETKELEGGKYLIERVPLTFTENSEGLEQYLGTDYVEALRGFEGQEGENLYDDLVNTVTNPQYINSNLYFLRHIESKKIVGTVTTRLHVHSLTSTQPYSLVEVTNFGAQGNQNEIATPIYEYIYETGVQDMINSLESLQPKDDEDLINIAIAQLRRDPQLLFINSYRNDVLSIVGRILFSEPVNTIQVDEHTTDKNRWVQSKEFYQEAIPQTQFIFDYINKTLTILRISFTGRTNAIQIEKQVVPLPDALSNDLLTDEDNVLLRDGDIYKAEDWSNIQYLNQLFRVSTGGRFVQVLTNDGSVRVMKTTVYGKKALENTSKTLFTDSSVEPYISIFERYGVRIEKPRTYGGILVRLKTQDIRPGQRMKEIG